MRRKRLQHDADVLSQMFCGWRLMNSYDRLLQLGSGTLHIDALTAHCNFADTGIEPLPIAEEMRSWLMADLNANGIPASGVLRAVLVTEILLDTIPWQARTTPPRSCIHLDK
jgi:hypothetical protein